MRCKKMLSKLKLKMIGLGEKRLSSWKKNRSNNSKFWIWKADLEPIQSFMRKRKNNLKFVLKRNMMLRTVNFCSNKSIMRTHLSSLMFWEWTIKMDMMSKRDWSKTRDKCRVRPWTMLPTDKGQDLQFLCWLLPDVRMPRIQQFW